MKRVAFHNLGCKVNSYELDVMRQMLEESGYTIVPFDSLADIYIINTCTVTNIADRKSRQMIHQAKKRNPEAVVVAVGCYVQTAESQAKLDECIDLAVGNNRKKDLAAILEEYLRNRAEATKPESGAEAEEAGEDLCAAGEEKIKVPDRTLGNTTVIDINKTSEYEEMTLKRSAERTRAYIKIQDGCNQFCSYCVIPYARGRVRSRKEKDILKEVAGLAAAGYREVVLTGIHISSYGVDFGEGADGLVDLVEHIHEIPGIERIRLGSLEPRIITQESARRLAALPKFCPHFHLSLQSGCDATLKRMNRHYTTGEYFQKVEILRREFDCPAITTDVIVGFPGETEEEFAQTREYLEKLGLYEMHIFKYSKRAGTRAAVMPDQVSEQVKTRRSSELLALERCQSKEFRGHWLGRKTMILTEEYKEIRGKRYLIGHTGDYVKVALPQEEPEAQTQGSVIGENTMISVEIEGFLTEEILLAGKINFYIN